MLKQLRRNMKILPRKSGKALQKESWVPAMTINATRWLAPILFKAIRMMSGTPQGGSTRKPSIPVIGQAWSKPMAIRAQLEPNLEDRQHHE